ncbi:MAG TPA: acyl carrier protein [Vicinamibacterales bacterium]|nr:acyl carrier protein [Vicinamibacterales bacterium]
MVEDVLLRCVGTSIGQQGGASLDDRLVDLQIDSLRFVQLVVQLEHALGIEFADESLDYRRFERIRDVLQYLEELVAESA